LEDCLKANILYYVIFCLAWQVLAVDIEKVLMLELKNLSLIFPDTQFQALFDINFTIQEGEILALVGESGSGKSLTALGILGLQPTTARLSGDIILRGENIVHNGFASSSLRKYRGKRIAYIPQDPLSSLNPVYTIADQLREAIEVHDPSGYSYARVIDALNAVGIADPDRCYSAYPHELSGGMRQRIMIAMAIINNPDLLIADEPTTALDVTVQAVILRLLKSLNKTILFITHDLGVVAEIADRVIVLQRGRIVESASVFEIFEKPESAYTKELLAAIPRI
jgi:peptide/nickel transport system ATP-binding protein